jgi:hypothetical protein
MVRIVHRAGELGAKCRLIFSDHYRENAAKVYTASMAEQQKLYAYVDESGQDTYGEMFLVSVVVTEETRDAARKALQGIEQASGKLVRKWTRSRVRERVAYIEQCFDRAALLGPVYYSHYRNTRAYVDLLILSTAKALHARVMERPTATVFVDGLVYAERRRFAAGLRKLNVVVHKVQGRRDESDEFIRLADAMAGFVRDALEGDQQMGVMFEHARRHGLIEEM